MTRSNTFERHLRQIVKEAVISAQRISSPPENGDKNSGEDDEGPPLGEEDRFWKIEETPAKEDDEEIYHSTFDDLAATHLEELTTGLNNQLDNLLLFAALFSGINSAFIVFSLPNLNDPFQGMDRLVNVLIDNGNNGTANRLAQQILNSQNSPAALNVALNVLFASSLICSLVTAFFAVVGKQWLSYLAEEPSDSDERTRRTKVQNKVIGIQRYRLRALLDAYLTTMMQIALLLFIVGLILFLYTFNNIVTGFVIAFAAAGMLAYIASAALALHDPACPFQTPVTRTIIPGLLSATFNAAYPIWVLVSSVIVLLKKEFKAVSTSQPQWDHRYTARRRLAESLQSIPKAKRVNTRAACWMIRTAENEMAARIAALMLLCVTEPGELTFVATYHDTTRRLRDVISVSDGVLKEEADVPAHIKDREWKKLCFYVQALSHIFAGRSDMDATQCQVMDWIYQYQKNRNPDKDKYTYTWVPARMVGAIKLLLLHLDGKHYLKMNPERENTLRHRLYQTPFESKCSSKSLSLAAFAMKALPNIASKGRDQTTDQQLHDDLWHSYVKNNLDVLRGNFAGAVATYADPKHSGEVQDLLPSAKQLQKLWKRIVAKEQGDLSLSADIATPEATDAIEEVAPTAVLSSSPVSDLPLSHDAFDRRQSEKKRTSDSNVLAGWKVGDRASLAEACFNLARRCSAGLPADEKFDRDAVCQIVRDIWAACYEDGLSCADEASSTSLVETVHRLRMAYAFLQAHGPELANSPLVPIGDEQCAKLGSLCLQWIKDAAANGLEDWKLAGDWLHTTSGARDAIAYFLKRLGDADPFGFYDLLGVDGWLLSLRPSSGQGESTSVPEQGDVVPHRGNDPGNMV